MDDGAGCCLPGTALGLAGEFNVFVFGDFAGFIDVLGDIAAGGSVLPLAGFDVGRDHAGGWGIVAGGDVTATSGTIHGDVWVGGLWTPSDVTLEGVVMRPPIPSPVNFAQVYGQMAALSTYLAGISANGTTGVTAGEVVLTGVDPLIPVYVFNLTSAQLDGAVSLAIDVPAGVTALVNVSGAELTIEQFGFLGTVDPARVLFNAYEAIAVHVQSMGMKGTLLAPGAAVDFNRGEWDGIVVASSMTGYGEMHWVPFIGALPCVPPEEEEEEQSPPPLQPFTGASTGSALMCASSRAADSATSPWVGIMLLAGVCGVLAAARKKTTRSR